jgi:hypothetical protein
MEISLGVDFEIQVCLDRQGRSETMPYLWSEEFGGGGRVPLNGTVRV